MSGESLRSIPWLSIPALALSGAGTLVFLFAPATRDPAWENLSAVAFLFIGALTTVAIAGATLRLPRDERNRWWWLVTAVGVISVADIMWSISGLQGIDPSYPGPADWIYLLGWMVLFVAILRLPARRRRTTERAKWILDATIATCSVGLVMWHTYLADAVQSAISTGSLSERIVSAAYPVVDLFNITGLTLILIRPTRFVVDRRLVAIGIGMLSLIVANASYMHQIADGTYWSGNWVNAFWFPFYGGVALAAALLNRPGSLAPLERHGRWWVAAPVYIAVGVLVVHEIGDSLNGHLDPLLSAGSAILMALVVLRQVVSGRENHHLLVKSRNDLIASVSHELRTPLAAIYGFTEILASGDVSESERDEMLMLVHDQTSYVNRIVADLVSSARGVLEHDELHLEVTPVSAIIEPAVASSGLGSTVAVDVHADLEAWCDRERARQIVLNLLTNAGRYGRGRVAVVAKPAGKQVIIEVHDDGPGVPRRFQDLVFEQFERGAHRLDSRVPGSGLGLSIARALSVAHGGSLTYRPSELLGGACFELRLPAAATEDLQRSLNLSTGASTRPIPSMRRPSRSSVAT